MSLGWLDNITESLSGIMQWIWLVLLFPVGLSLRQLIKKYIVAFENELASAFENCGKLTAKKLLTIVQYLFTQNYKKKYFQCLIEDNQDYKIQGFKTKGTFVLDLEKVFVSLRITPQSLERTSSDIFREGSIPNAQATYSIWNLLAASDEPAHKCFVIIGTPGSGKTTLLRHLTLTFAKKKYHNYATDIRPKIPVLLVLRDHIERITTETGLTIPVLLSEIYHSIMPNSSINWFSFQLSRGKCLVMLDGLDEVGDSEQRKVVSLWINGQINKYSNSCFIITSRPFGYRSAPVERVRAVYEVQTLNIQEVTIFIKNWYLTNETMRRLGRIDNGVKKQAELYANDLIKRIQNNSSLTMLAINPLLLTMIAIVHDNRGSLPGRRVELYAELCDVMLGRRHEAKGLFGMLSAHQNQRILQVLALELMKNKVRTVGIDNASLYIQDRLIRIAGSDILAIDFIKQMENLSGLLVEREAGEFEFAHKSIQEYLAAVEIKESGQEQLLINNIDEPWWEETIRLFIVQTTNTNLLFQHMISKNSVTSLAFAYDCLNEGAEILPEYRDALKNKVDIALESKDINAANLASEVKIHQRMKHFERIDENRWIDRSHITCAEYQLFINDIQKHRARNFQPDHWNKNRFSPGEATHSISGIRSSDAKEFCNWLNKKYGVIGFSFRLPKPDEVSLIPLKERENGFWWEYNNVIRIACTDQNHVEQQINTILESEEKWLPQNIDISSALERVLSSTQDTEAISKILNILEDDFKRAQKAFENPDREVSFIELAKQFVWLDGEIGGTVHYNLKNIANSFKLARDKDRSRKLATQLQKAHGIENSIYLISRLKAIIERDINRNLDKDLDYIRQLVEILPSIASILTYLNENIILDLYAFVLVNSERRKNNHMHLGLLRIIREAIV